MAGENGGAIFARTHSAVHSHDMAEDNLMEKIVSLCKRRGFIYPGSEIDGALPVPSTTARWASN